MEVNKYTNVNEFPSGLLSHPPTNSVLVTLQALKDGHLRPEALDPRRRQELREVVLWEMDKERMKREIIMAKIEELRMSMLVEKATDLGVRYVGDEETGGMSLEERIGRRAAVKHAIRKYGTETFSSYRATDW